MTGDGAATWAAAAALTEYLEAAAEDAEAATMIGREEGNAAEDEHEAEEANGVDDSL